MFSLPKQKSQQRTDVCFRNLPAPAGKILAVATGVTAGPANLGRIDELVTRVVAAFCMHSAEKKLPGHLPGAQDFLFTDEANSDSN